ncbi:hypothetical protein L596_001396 [Steinernema carpocapsae]|uniref:DNA mismatch repair protein S5 domain-containing protein n=1 Tax=Steinernema carpocapsae TaxID=34508 RepID=A0A4U8UL47_STECR|nr:hypothetical protein L596_001396 [Steinernema carpocapsae]
MNFADPFDKPDITLPTCFRIQAAMENAPETDSKEQPVTDEAPARISALSQETVNKIAAGEVVVRPANVVKELLENSLDAGATEIIITAKKGGMELIQIQDNGKGIHADDLPIVCERFTTSKLKSYEELKEISTFGFRGEALASVSYCAHLCIKSKTKADVCANMAKYKDSRIVGTVTRSAATQGTTITVESLFYNNPARRRAMKSAADEMNKISDVITQYAINYPKVSFSFRRCGNGTDFRTTGNGYKADVVCSLMGKKIGRELIELDHNSYHLKFTMEGCMAKPSAQCTAYGLQDRQNRHKAFHLFINGRSVECPALKQMMDTCFAGKQVSCPFLFLSLTIAPERVDVNVHPAKKTVFFLDQERIIDSIDEYIASIIDQVFGDQDLDSGSYLSTLTTSSQIVSEKKSEPSSKSTTSKQLKLTFHERPRSVSPARSEDLFNDSAGSVVFNMSAPKTPVYAHHLVRTDAGERSLSEFQPSSADTSRDFNVSDVCVSQFSTDDEEEETESMEEKSVGDKEIEATQSFREIDLDSVRELRKEICEASSDTLREMFKQMAVVGPVDAQYAMVQFSTAMYKIDINVIAREFFYQSIIFSLGNLGSFKLNNVDSNLLAITEVLQLVGEDMRPTDEDSKEAAQYLLSQSEMLWDYFSIAIEEEDDGSIIIEALPSIIDGYVPALEGLPNFIMNLLMKVDWGDEKACIEGIARCLADFFTATILILKELEDDETEAQEEEMPEASEGEAVEESLLIDNDEDFEEEEVKPVPESPWKKLVCHYLIPACKAKLIPPESFKAEEEGVIMRVVDLHDLYKVFERC